MVDSSPPAPLVTRVAATDPSSAVRSAPGSSTSNAAGRYISAVCPVGPAERAPVRSSVEQLAEPLLLQLVGVGAGKLVDGDEPLRDPVVGQPLGSPAAQVEGGEVHARL